MLSLFLFFGQLWGQNCQFDIYKKKGSLYYFSTYYSDYSKTTMEGECTMLDQHGRIYEKRVFKNGIIQSEELHHYMNEKPRIIYKRKDKDSIIGIAEDFDESARLHERNTYYWNKDKRRCWLNQTFHPNGNLIKESSYVMFRADEIVAAGNPVPPEHIVDSEGFADDIMPFGWEYDYYPNGKLMTKKYHRTIVAETQSSYDGKSTLEGPYELWNEQGNLLVKGQYMEGREHGIWNQYHLNGKLSGVKQFDNGTPIGTWRSYHENGITSYEAFHDVDVYNCFTPRELFYNANGQLLQEKWIKSNGQGFNRKWNDKGVMIFEETYMNGPSPQYPEARKEWYPSGQLKYLTHLNGRRDTAYLSYYENGVMEKINRDGIHYQMQKEQYPNGQLKMFSEATHYLDHTSYHYESYFPNGNLNQQSDRNKDTTIEKYGFMNGQMRVINRKVKFNLDGLYLEWDSLGKVVWQCQYKGGIRMEKGEGQSRMIFNAISQKDEEKVKSLVHFSVAAARSPFVGRDSIQWMVEKAKKAIGFLPQTWRDHVLEGNENYPDSFMYQIIFKNPENDSIQAELMSFMDSLGLKMHKKIEAYNGWNSAIYCCRDYYNDYTLTNLFQSRLKKVPVQIHYYDPTLYNTVTTDVDWKGVRRDYRPYVQVIPSAVSDVFLFKINFGYAQRDFIVYSDDIEPRNRMFDWTLPQQPYEPHIPWD